MTKKNLTLIEKHVISRGEQHVYEHDSATTHCTMRFAVYLPKDSLDGDSCPVLYYLSGLTCTEQNVIQKSGFQRFANRYNIIVVCPDTSPRGEEVADDENYWMGKGAGFYVNATQSPWAEHYQMYDYVAYELPALINDNFPSNGLQSITGHSMGGYGALSIGLSNPDNYQSISAFAPIVSPQQSEWGKGVFEHYFGEDKTAYQKLDPCSLVQNSKKKLPILIDQGTADEFLQEHLKTTLFIEAAEKANYPVEVNMREGYDHSYYFIQSYIMQHMVFHAEYLDAN